MASLEGNMQNLRSALRDIQARWVGVDEENTSLRDEVELLRSRVSALEKQAEKSGRIEKRLRNDVPCLTAQKV
jgi:regulator of replication initiation timing